MLVRVDNLPVLDLLLPGEPTNKLVVVDNLPILFLSFGPECPGPIYLSKDVG